MINLKELKYYKEMKSFLIIWRRIKIFYLKLAFKVKYSNQPDVYYAKHKDI